jgi:phosphoglycerate dehydrogenase-like enzyme
MLGGITMKVLVGLNPMGLEKGIPALQEQYPDINFVYCPDRGELLARELADSDIYMGWINRELFLGAPKLKWIQSPSSGVNFYLDIPELVESDVLLSSASGTHAACVADSAMAMILAMNRGIVPSVLDQSKSVWNPTAIRPNLKELTGSTVGIIGLGAIGRAFAQRVKAFDTRVIAVDLNPNTTSPHVDQVQGLDKLDDLLAESDYVVILVPFTAQTKNMIGAAQLAKMKPTALLVPMSRGGIVDQDALIAALKNGQIGGLASDVFSPEPLPADSELWGLPNVLITPHIAGGTQYEGKYVLEIFTENLRRFLNNELPLRNQVDKQLGF